MILVGLPAAGAKVDAVEHVEHVHDTVQRVDRRVIDQQGSLPLDPSRIGNVIGVEKGHELATGGDIVQSGVAGRRDALARVLEQAHLGKVAGHGVHDRPGLVARPVVDHDDVQIDGLALAQQRPDRRLDEAAGIEGRHDDANRHFVAPSPGTIRSHRRSPPVLPKASRERPGAGGRGRQESRSPRSASPGSWKTPDGARERAAWRAVAGSIEVRRSRATSGMSRAPISIRSASPLGDNLRRLELDFAMPIEFGGVELALRHAGATKSLPILLEHGEDRMGDHARRPVRPARNHRRHCRARSRDRQARCRIFPNRSRQRSRHRIRRARAWPHG